ncbi:MAG: HypC/HybG/HupF family hydrogenase formation chaperone [Gammaproteobacteria bacterium]|nr:MAG: HypC/HybG/HupF family hydrogenase formation chaperone [Gammaproteobacteria bacterium]
MCIGVPYRVLHTDGQVATVEAAGHRREVSLLMLSEPVRPGDYVVVEIGGFATSRIEPARAQEILELMTEIQPSTQTGV